MKSRWHQFQTGATEEEPAPPYRVQYPLMSELVPAPFADLVTRLLEEPARQDRLFELDRRRWYLPDPGGPDLSVAFHGTRAGNPSGPAAGPHTQMAQNLLLSYIAGGRILELKTVQINDRLTIPRPCIDMTNVGYNVEWSQELLVEQSLREYVAGSMLIEIFRASRDLTGGRLDGTAGECVLDISVGYDLAGIRGDKIRGFLEGMRHAGPIVESLRREIPARHGWVRDLPFKTRLSDSITLSTFHGCPVDEIERITEFLIGECGFDVIVKMNPPSLGRARLEHLLHDVLGYTELWVNPSAYSAVTTFVESVELCNRLRSFAARRGRRVGFKFSNTLEVENHRDFFTPDNQVMYLSGQPLHVITMTLVDEFRRAVGADVPISFSAGIDQQNFPAAVACGFVPITVSTDLLRPGGYGRLGGYLQRLTAEMKAVGAVNVDQYILKRYGQGGDVLTAGLRNTTLAAEAARNDPRYRAAANRKIPTRIDSHLQTFDCVTCDKCLPVCPNAANFTYPTPVVAFDYQDVIVAPDGSWRLGEQRRFEIKEAMQIACFADFCNECGNCDTFCPEYGGPYIKKPSFFGSVASWTHATKRDGFVIGETGEHAWIQGRIQGRVYRLERGATDVFDDGAVRVRLRAADGGIESVEPIDQEHRGEHVIDMGRYHTLRHLHDGIRDARRINQVNAGALDR